MKSASPLKIAFIRTEFDPFGGAERFTNTLMEEMAKQGAEIHIFARKWKESTSPLYTVHHIGGINSPSLLRQFTFVTNVRKKLQNHNFDLVQSNERTLSQNIYRAGDGVHARWLELRKQKAGFIKKISLTINPFHLYTTYLERKMFEQRELQAIIVNSNMVRDEITDRFKVDTSKIHTIYNGVDLARFSPDNRQSIGVPLRRQQHVSDDEPIILFVGSGYERKGVRQLLQASAQLSTPCRIWIVGKDSTPRYQKMAKLLGITKQVTFWGQQQEVEKFYAASDIFVLPTLYDPFPSVTLEAMASQLPIIITKTCGTAEVIEHGKEGFILNDQDDISLHAYLETLVSNTKKRRKMAKLAANLATGFSMTNTVQQFSNLYRQIIKQNRKI